MFRVGLARALLGFSALRSTVYYFLCQHDDPDCHTLLLLHSKQCPVVVIKQRVSPDPDMHVTGESI